MKISSCFFQISLILSLSLVTNRHPLFAQQSADRPNFIILLSDDQSWDGLSVRMDPDIPESSNPYVQTPNIERLAREGMRFTHAYASSPVCAPSRAGLLTGITPGQLHWTKAGPNIDPGTEYKLIPPQSIKNIPEDTITIAELLKTAGYTSAHFGKWHLGGGGPEAHGYDESDGDTSNKDAAPFVPPNPVDIFGMGQRAVQFMKKASEENQPFFIQMSYHALHYPQNAYPESIKKYRSLMTGSNEKEILRAAMAQDLDTGVGELLDQLDEMGLSDSTYVIYMSDNGGNGGRNHLLQGGKGSVGEAGIRVPFIIRGPGISAGSVSSIPIAGHDLLPTFTALGQVPGDLPSEVEGGDISPLLFGQDYTVSRRLPGLTFHFPHYQKGTPQTAMIKDQYKAILNYETDSIQLYNIVDDPGETEDLAQMHPDVYDHLSQILQIYIDEMHIAVPEQNPAYKE